MSRSRRIAKRSREPRSSTNRWYRIRGRGAATVDNHELVPEENGGLDIAHIVTDMPVIQHDSQTSWEVRMAMMRSCLLNRPMRMIGGPSSRKPEVLEGES